MQQQKRHVLLQRPHGAPAFVQDRKRQLDGVPRSATEQQPQQKPDAAIRWASAGGQTSAAKRQEGAQGGHVGAGATAAAAAAWGQPQAQQGGAGGADDPIEVDGDDDGQDSGE